MKKSMTILVSVLLTLALTLGASAASLDSVGGVTAPEISDIVASDGSTIAPGDAKVVSMADVASLAEEAKEVLEKVFDEVTSSGNMESFLVNSGLAEQIAEVIPLKEATVQSFFDLDLSGSAAAVLANGGSLTLTFDVPGVKDGDKVAVLHYMTDEAKWEMLAGVAGLGVVTATFKGNSPVMIVVQDDEVKESPKTGEATMGLSLLAIAAGSALLILNNRKKH